MGRVGILQQGAHPSLLVEPLALMGCRGAGAGMGCRGAGAGKGYCRSLGVELIQGYRQDVGGLLLLPSLSAAVAVFLVVALATIYKFKKFYFQNK